MRNFGAVELSGRGFSSAVRLGCEGTSGPDGVTLERQGFPTDEILVRA
jgi:hypothetical protein